MANIKLNKTINIFVVPAKNSWWVLKISRDTRLAGDKKNIAINNTKIFS